ncbi:helix-turn-helix transcriptional regulator [Kitasatospora viridis]|uniref:Regulatory LuxR family protein n=1 Tax=Kitasatospora viridis TaxID=281105 RepID=A0A561UG36_9ACTN|nr:LuxR family transcriptional regulator [Kitasatospora viridis]TWF98315.1 regulatory LuxR family protein [Kitasatospora viridis]
MPELRGRDAELDAARRALGEHGALLLTGPAGIGRTALAGALAAAAERDGQLVLRCAPAPEERELPWAALGDLLGGRPLDALAPSRRDALRAALLHHRSPADGEGRLALRRAVLDLLLALRGEHGAVLVVLDGVAWLDPPSAAALRFALRRAVGQGVRVLATRRTGEDACRFELPELRLGPLSPAALAELLADRYGRLPVPVLGGIQRAALGNPGTALDLAASTRPDGTAHRFGGPTVRQPASAAELLAAARGARPEEARALARQVLGQSRSGVLRARAHLVLARAAAVEQGLAGAVDLLAAGLAEAPAQSREQGELLRWVAEHHLRAGQLPLALAQAEAAAGHRRADPAAPALLARVRAALGDPGGAAEALAAAPPGPERALAALALGEPGPALRTEGDEALALRITAHALAGEAVTALALARRLADLLAWQGDPLPGTSRLDALLAVAVAELTGGSAERARRLALRAAAGWAAAGDRWHRAEALAVAGEAALLLGTAAANAAAVEDLEAAGRLPRADRFGRRARALLAEARVTQGDHAVARQLVGAVPQSTDEPATVRARALALAGLGQAREAVALLRAAADRQRGDGRQRLELARTLLALGSVERRLRHRTGARVALGQAHALCAAAAAAPLLARVAEELARLDQSADGPLLTATEQRIAGLAADGATNREVAAALFVSVKTVEGTLSRVYRKLGVRSRAALVRALPVARQG